MSDERLDDGPAALPHFIKVDHDQLGQVLEVLRGQPQRTLSLDNAQKICQIVAVVVAAMWTVYLFVTFVKPAQDMETKLRRLQIVSTEEHALAFSRRLEAVPLGSGLYRVLFAFSITNKSSMPAEVSAIIVRRFVAKSLKTQSADLKLFEFGDPDERGILQWTEGEYISYVYAPWQQTSVMLAVKDGVREFRLDRKGGATGELGPGETTDASLPFLIKAEDGDWVGFNAHIIADRSKTPEGRWLIVSTSTLSDAVREATGRIASGDAWKPLVKSGEKAAVGQ